MPHDQLKPLGTLVGRSAKVFIKWWFAELSGMIPDRVRSRFAATTDLPLLEMVNNKAYLRILRRGILGASINLPSDHRQLSQALNESLRDARFVGHHGIGLLLDASAVLTRQIELPLSAEPHIASILLFEASRQTPFRPDEILVGWEIVARNSISKQLHVRMTILPNSDIADMRSTVEAAGARLSGVYVRGPAGEQACSAYLVVKVSIDAAPSERSLRRWTNGLAVALLLCLAWTKWIEISALSDEIDAAARELAAGRPAVQRAISLERELQATIQRMANLQRTQARLSPLRILDDLARLLPDGTWLSHVQIAYPTVTIFGYSSQTASVVATLGESSAFYNPQYQTPITVSADQQERFVIALRVREEAKQ